MIESYKLLVLHAYTYQVIFLLWICRRFVIFSAKKIINFKEFGTDRSMPLLSTVVVRE